jgi:hypothetical protein
MTLRKFPRTDEPGRLHVGDIVKDAHGGSWQITERFTTFSVFVLKNQLSGKSIVVAARYRPEESWYLREVQNPEGRRIYQREAQRKHRRKKLLATAA